MQISQKCQYALRATFELARRYGCGPVKIADIAEAQAIPVRFLEQILSQLRQGGFVRSRRGNAGGYLLEKLPEALSVGEIIRFVEGSLGPVECMAGSSGCPLDGSCVFLPMWEKAKEAMAAVYDSTTLQRLVEDEARRRGERALDYCI